MNKHVEEPMIKRIKMMSASDLAEWLWNFGLNCVGMTKGDIYRMLMKGDESWEEEL